MTAAANTRACFEGFVGQVLSQTLFDKGTTTLIFEDGRGLVIASNGSYWIETKGRHDVD